MEGYAFKAWINESDVYQLFEEKGYRLVMEDENNFLIIMTISVPSAEGDQELRTVIKVHNSWGDSIRKCEKAKVFWWCMACLDDETEKINKTVEALVKDVLKDV